MIAVPAIRRSNQAAAMVLGYLAFGVVYLGSGALRLVAPTALAPSALDAAVPYLGWSVWVYLSQFLLIASGILFARDDLDRSHTFYALLVATVAAAPFFIAWPTTVPRVAPGTDGITGLAWRLLHLADTPANCFPSLHVALAVISARALWRRGWQTLATVWPILIIVSTLTTRQHVAWDIPGGLALGIFALWLTPRILRLERAQLADDTADA